MTQPEKHMAICQEQNDIYTKKNHDYGNVFHQSFEKYGMVMPLIRLGDKLNRLETLVLRGNQMVSDESVVDTLYDLANYAIMTIMEAQSDEVADGFTMVP